MARVAGRKTEGGEGGEGGLDVVGKAREVQTVMRFHAHGGACYEGGQQVGCGGVPSKYHRTRWVIS